MTHAATTENRRRPRKLKGVIAPGSPHWVGDGFHVRSVIHPQMAARDLSPFLLLDHAAPHDFAPTDTPRGVGEHPHRGFETVTFAYQGEVEHRDSAGGGGRIGPGDVQWMTAAAGVVHEEKHSSKFSREGGRLEMVQLWVNLPADQKMSAPGYQSLLDGDFPRLRLGDAEARLVAGVLEGQRGPGQTRTPLSVFDLCFDRPGRSRFELPKGWTTLVFPLEGQLEVGAERRTLPAHHLAVFDTGDHGDIELYAGSRSRALVLAGEVIDEPVAAHGPFVMNTRAELVTAMNDYRSGRMGHLI